MASLRRCDECGRTSDDGSAGSWFRIGRLDGLEVRTYGGGLVGLAGDYCSAACVEAKAKAFDLFTRLQPS